ncbi:acetylcholinesterase precursor [Aaosphaeria arxii CBS 175.79]|uniref:Carboxylic ester hydrolase n=1 Tax=Aaosphaeria arxii CBS 175.79 TaxID=1450172 RepID=A0A6A5XZX9_9PLEO|nr:acetylcholinesterase precursor [Aaosphaeria arxii CBS 175.79]KAF2018367.1 acetylcholinesterase precursor [Aaosphaeria arxii CBS 175.79]
MLKLAATVVALLGAAYAENASLPVVDLGYELHQASNFNESYRFYNFSNIRYAAPPLGELRFAPPAAPEKNRSSINNGSIGRICPQAGTGWNSVAVQFLTSRFLGLPFNYTQPYVPTPSNQTTPVARQDPRASEDCLFLDVFVPEKVFNSTGKSQSNGYSNGKSKGAPVLVWIYGGGYVGGNKYTNPAGLLAMSGYNSTTNGEGDIVYVALNYRLGAMGFTSGPTYQAEGGTANLALLDQRFALEWVKKNIHLFGGDPDRVTVFGESAGGGSIMHQITAYGGSQGPAPFQRAIPQSPGWLPVSSQLQQEDAFQRLLNLTNTTTLAELRKVPTEALIRANSLQVLEAPYGSYIYGPVVDGNFTPAQPPQLLAQGRFDKDVEIMVGHNTAEGVLFTPPNINSTADINRQLRGVFPYIPQRVIDYVTTELYPPVGSKGTNTTANVTELYTTEYDRAALIVAESIFTCNTRYLTLSADANNASSYSYLFAVPPGIHGQDLSYTFWDGGPLAPASSPLGVRNATVAAALQGYITSFTEEGVPSANAAAANAGGVIGEFQTYGDGEKEARVLRISDTGIRIVKDSNQNGRCDFWQKGLFS